MASIRILVVIQHCYNCIKGRPISFDQIVSNVLMIQNMGLSSSIIGTGWSLSVEFLHISSSLYMHFTMSKNAYKSLYIFYFLYA